MQLTATVPVKSGEVFDGKNKRYNLNGGGQAEGQPPLFEVADGGSVINVVIGPLAADGIHCLGNCVLDHVWWEDVGEDAATAMGPKGTIMKINCGSTTSASDKTFQFNGRGEFHLSNFYVGDAGKVIRSCGDCTANGGPRTIFLENVIAHNVTTIVGINVNPGFEDKATIRNLVIDNSFGTKTKVCLVHEGVVKGNGSSSQLGLEIDTKNCDYRATDVTLKNGAINTSYCKDSNGQTTTCPLP